jgi:hypothetical protein
MRTTPFMAALLFSGCFIPFPRHAELQPRALFVVLDEKEKPIKNAKVLIQRFSQPHHQIHESFEQFTDDAGVAQFDEVREWETIFPLMMHGVPFYDFAYCAQAPGFNAQWAELPKMNGTPVLDSGVFLRLQPGDAACPDPKALVY